MGPCLGKAAIFPSALARTGSLIFGVSALLFVLSKVLIAKQAPIPRPTPALPPVFTGRGAPGQTSRHERTAEATDGNLISLAATDAILKQILLIS